MALKAADLIKVESDTRDLYVNMINNTAAVTLKTDSMSLPCSEVKLKSKNYFNESLKFNPLLQKSSKA